MLSYLFRISALGIYLPSMLTGKLPEWIFMWPSRPYKLASASNILKNLAPLKYLKWSILTWNNIIIWFSLLNISRNKQTNKKHIFTVVKEIIISEQFSISEICLLWRVSELIVSSVKTEKYHFFHLWWGT